MTISGKNYFSYDFPIDKTGKMFIIYNCSDTVGEIMADILDKESPVALPRQLKQILQQRIETAYYTPGRKIDSVRKISAEFKVSSLTVQRALKQLESDGFVVSVPASGIFVNDQFAKEKSPVKMAFVFPEAEISQKILPPENWALSSEIYRGLLSGAQKYGAQVDFIYVDKDMELLQMLRQVKRLGRYHALVFAGEQLLDLQLKMAQEMPIFRVPATREAIPGLLDIDYDREAALSDLAAHAKDCGCKTVGTISYIDVKESSAKKELRNFYDERTHRFLEACRTLGLETPDHLQVRIGTYADPMRCLSETLKQGYPDFIFYNHTDSVPIMYEACAELGIQIGKDLKMAAIATGFTFQGLIPSLTYVRVPMFELARDAVCDACRLVSDGLSVSALQRKKLHAPLITGKSTMEYKTSKEKEL